MVSASHQEITELVQRTYNRIWNDWYANIPGAAKAALEVPQSDHSAGYSHSRNLLLIPVLEGNLEDADIRDEAGWPIWKIELVHEMLHEWQYKKPCMATPEATELHKKFGNKFWGNGHGPEFFQAIVEKAPYFQMKPEQIIPRL